MPIPSETQPRPTGKGPKTAQETISSITHAHSHLLVFGTLTAVFLVTWLLVLTPAETGLAVASYTAGAASLLAASGKVR